MGNRKHKDSKFSIWGEQGNKQIYFSGTREHVSPPPERASCMYRLLILSKYVPQTTQEGNIFGCIFAGSLRVTVDLKLCLLIDKLNRRNDLIKGSVNTFPQSSGYSRNI